MKTVPPLNDLFNMAGLNLPTYLKGEDKRKNNANDKRNKTLNCNSKPIFITKLIKRKAQTNFVVLFILATFVKKNFMLK
jgi:hypothetical protein